MNLLLSKYSPFQMNYNTMKDKWHVHELHSMLVQEETRLKAHGNYSIHYVNYTSKKVERNMEKERKGTIKDC